jgi:hypothetical protein
MSSISILLELGDDVLQPLVDIESCISPWNYFRISHSLFSQFLLLMAFILQDVFIWNVVLSAVFVAVDTLFRFLKEPSVPIISFSVKGFSLGPRQWRASKSSWIFFGTILTSKLGSWKINRALIILGTRAHFSLKYKYYFKYIKLS